MDRGKEEEGKRIVKEIVENRFGFECRKTMRMNCSWRSPRLWSQTTCKVEEANER
jgi:hypothetical protein